MKKIVWIMLLCLAVNTLQAQVNYQTLKSEKLGGSRDLKILLPRGYSQDTKKKYPLIVVLDGDYMFEAVTGNTDFYSYWEDIPEAIVVGINQSNTRFEDAMYSDQNSFPVDSGADFFEFISLELLPHMQKNFRTENFKMIIGHGETANFINYFLLKDQPVFQAYVVLSPDLAPQTGDYVSERLQSIDSKVFYYMATSTNDVPVIKSKTEAFDKQLKALESKNVLYNFDLFEGPSHYTLPAHAIPKALESIFLIFQPISKKEYSETIVKLEGNPVDYLTEKYGTIKNLFGIEKQILINDFKAIAAAIEKNKSFEHYEALGKLARKEYPDALLGHYFLGRYYEETNAPKKAMKTFQSAYILEEIGGYTKDEMLERASKIKSDFGY